MPEGPEIYILSVCLNLYSIRVITPPKGEMNVYIKRIIY